MSDFEKLGTWVTPLLNHLSISERTKLTRKLAMEFRKRTQARIKFQQDVDGNPFIPRKSSNSEKSGQPMFREISKLRWLRTQAKATSASVGYSGGAAVVARVHQEGKMDTVRKGGTRKYPYPRRELLGFGKGDERWFESKILDHLDQ